MRTQSGSAPRGRLLLLADHYLPGYKAGGPIKSLRNLVGALGEEYEFRIATRNRDLGDPKPYDCVPPERWVERGDAKVCYLSSGIRGLAALAMLLRQTPHNVLYLQSLFSWPFTIWPLLLRRFRLVASTPVLIAPRGELSPGALTLKARKKRAYLQIARLLGLYDDVVWQASSEEEQTHLQDHFGVEAEIHIGPNIPVHCDTSERELKQTDGLRILFLSRISRKKNLAFALRVVGSLDVASRLTIVGPIEDERYWRECREVIESLPDRISVEFLGSIRPDRIEEVYLTHDILFLPTLGENYGWVVAEALSAGCPVLISDQTPWRDLEQNGVGWDLPLSASSQFADALRTVHQMTGEQHREMSLRASQWVRASAGSAFAIGTQRTIFDRILQAAH